MKEIAVRVRIAKPNDNTLAHILAICAFTLIASIVLGFGSPSPVHATERATQIAVGF